ncbi:MAG TPA: hypothetical protein VM597_41305 [Gemmataceae bacterium]|nr:hypothetical protein [Gemmataceae bacterium]
MTARYRAPAADGGVLADPPFAALGAQLEENRRRLAAPVRILDVSLTEFRAAAAAEVLASARDYLGDPPAVGGAGLLMAGHQPELFHPGVWAKNFALSQLARTHGLVPLNLVVDNDTPRTAALKIPVPANEPEHATAVTVPFDAAAGDAPYEETHVADRELFGSFAKQVRAHTGGWGYEPILDNVWPCVVGAVDAGATPGEAFVRMRRCVERAWGVANLELPVSRLSGTQAFAGFVAAVLSDLPRFADAYNAAIRDYRAVNKLHSRNHPAPELARDGGWVEAPFWAWRAGSGRRERLFARRGEVAIELRAGGREVGRLPADPTGFRTHWPALAGAGWKIRPRALSLTLFVRLCLADGFLHGIGGGKYDEVTDAILRRYFGLTPPAFAVVTATLRLPIPTFPTTVEDVRRTERTVRDLDWKPETTETVRSEFPDTVARKAALLAAEPTPKGDRRRWFRELQGVTRSMRPAVAAEHDSAEARLARMRRELVANDVLKSREYSWVLFPESKLKAALVGLG